MTLVALQPRAILRSARQGWFPLLALLPGACYWTDCTIRDDPPTTVSRYIDVIPKRVLLPPGKTFVMRVRVLDQYKAVLGSEAVGQVEWTIGTATSSGGVAHLAIVSKGDDSVLVRALDSDVLVKETLTATVATNAPGGGTMSAPADILINPTNRPDSVFADDRSHVPPDVMLMDYTLPAANVTDSIIAFVAASPYGDFKTGAGEVARFASDQRFSSDSVKFRTSGDPVDFTSQSTATQSVDRTPLQLTLTIWIASTDPDAPGMIADDVDRAQQIFSRHRTGLTLSKSVNAASSSGSYLLEAEPPDYKCPQLKEHLQNLGVPAPGQTDKSLRVVYVDEILVGNASEVSPSVWAGYTCPWDADAGIVVLVALKTKSHTTLTHELGHVLGLLAPDWGHTDNVAHFSHSNIMWHTDEDESTAPRSGFTLGQVFRMNLDARSWLFRAGFAPERRKRTCDPSGGSTACPQLDREIVPLP